MSDVAKIDSDNNISFIKTDFRNYFGLRLLRANRSNNMNFTNCRFYNISSYQQNGTVFYISSNQNTFGIAGSVFNFIRSQINPSFLSNCNLNRKTCTCGTLLFAEGDRLSLIVQNVTFLLNEGYLGVRLIIETLNLNINLFKNK